MFWRFGRWIDGWRNRRTYCLRDARTHHKKQNFSGLHYLRRNLPHFLGFGKFIARWSALHLEKIRRQATVLNVSNVNRNTVVLSLNGENIISLKRIKHIPVKVIVNSLTGSSTEEAFHYVFPNQKKMSVPNLSEPNSKTICPSVNFPITRYHIHASNIFCMTTFFSVVVCLNCATENLSNR